MRVLLTCAVVAAMAAAASFAGFADAAEIGESTSDIEAHIRRADFDAAERAARQLLRSGSLARQEVARVYLQLGIIAAARRDSGRATEAFRNALRLDRDLTLHASAGPHVAELFARVKSSTPPAASAGPAIALSAAPGTGDVSVEVGATPADEALARRVSVKIGDSQERRDIGPDPLRFSFPLPALVHGCATATASVLDEFGNELWPTVTSQNICRLPPALPVSLDGKRPHPPIVVEPAPLPANVVSTKTATATHRCPISCAVWVTAAMTGAAAVGTGVLGFVALERRDDYDGRLGGTATADQLRQLRESAVTAEHRATAGAIMTGVLAAVTAVLYIRGRF